MLWYAVIMRPTSEMGRYLALDAIQYWDAQGGWTPHKERAKRFEGDEALKASRSLVGSEPYITGD